MDTKTQLIEKAGHYFKDEKVKLMYATPDGNFFYENCKNYADSHAKTKKIEVFVITRADLKEKTEEKIEENKDELDELRKIAKKLKIKGYGIMKLEKLKQKIQENTEENK